MHFFDSTGIREIDFGLTKDTINELRKEWMNSLRNFSEHPKVNDERGILTCGGGVKYFACLWVCINILRRNGCDLPIEVWHLENEITTGCAKALHKLGVKTVDASKIADRNLIGYMIKPFAILNCSFKEVLFLDADNICLHNPKLLFNDPEYLRKGALFWPDYWTTAVDNPIWEIMGIKYRDMKEQESGQLLINREKCWDQLQLCMFLNFNEDVYYKLLIGDKDTFRFSWMALKKDFGFIEHEPGTCGYIDEDGNFMGHTMLQYLPDKTPSFLHRNLLKWSSSSFLKKNWTHSKKFIAEKKIRGYKIAFSERNSHYFIDLYGDTQIADFEKYFGNIEEDCLEILSRLFKEKFYINFLNSLKLPKEI